MLIRSDPKGGPNQIVPYEVRVLTANINVLVEEFQELPLGDQEYVSEIIAKQLIEFKRERLAVRVQEARANYTTNQIKTGSFDMLMEDLEND